METYGIYWKPVSKAVLIICLVLAVLFWIYAFTDEDGFLFLDYVNLPFHEFGHLFFGIFGDKIGIWGGTLMQVLIPLAICIGFAFKGETLGVAFTFFWVGENLLNISVYIADAKEMYLPLVGGGIHDWNTILWRLGLIDYDDTIGGIVKACGWVIMVAAMAFLAYMSYRTWDEEE